ncbi:MAG: ABC-type uncharacterized transport system [Planctomycetota bacterium]
MKATFARLGPASLAVAALLLLALAAGWSARARPLDFDPRSPRLPAPATLARLDQLGEPLLVEWYRSGDEELDGAWRAAFRDVEGFLERLQRHPLARVRVVQPELDQHERSRAAALGLSAARVRSLRADGWSERSIWSALRVSLGARGAAALERLDPDHIRELPALFDGLVEEISAPRRAKVGLSAPPGHRRLRAVLERQADVVELDFDADASIPPDLDLLFLVAPARADQRHLSALAAHRARGGATCLALEPGSTATILAGDLGLRIEQGLRGEDGLARVRSLPADQDFRGFARQPDGPLWFESPACVQGDASLAAEQGVELDLLAAAAAGTLEESGARGAGAPLFVQVRPLDPWRGRSVVAGDAGWLKDGWIDLEGGANEALASLLAAEARAPARRAARVARGLAPPATEPPDASTRWRFLLSALALPGLVLAAWAARALARGERVGRGREAAATAGFACAGLALVALASGAAPAARPTLDARVEALVRDLPPGSRLDLFADAEASLPPDVRARLPELAALVEALGAIDASRLATRRVAADDSTPSIVRAVRTGDFAASWRFRCALRAQVADQVEWLPIEDAPDARRAAFVAAMVLGRLSGKLDTRVAFASVPARLAPAEARLLYEARGSFAPGSADRHAAARALLADHGFLVRRVGEDGLGAEDARLFVLAQPRRDGTPLVARLATHLASGRPALVAAQEAVVAPRARAENERSFALWPRPQYADLDRAWLPRLGLRREEGLLVDPRHGTARAQGYAQDGAAPTASWTTLASPIVPLLVARWDDASGTRRLDAPSPDAWTIDRARLSDLGLAARPILSSSPLAGLVPWRGGDLDEDLEPAGIRSTRHVAWLVEGSFPPPSFDPLLGAAGRESDAKGKATRLVLCGASEPFADAQLAAGEDDAQAILLEWCVRLSLGDEWAAALPDAGADRVLVASTWARHCWRAAALLAPVVLALFFVRWRRGVPFALALACLAAPSCREKVPARPLAPLVEPALLEGRAVAAISCERAGAEALWVRSKGLWRSREAQGAVCDDEAIARWLSDLRGARGAALVEVDPGKLGFDDPLVVRLHGPGYAKQADKDLLVELRFGAWQPALDAPPRGRALARAGTDGPVLELDSDLAGVVAAERDGLPPFVDGGVLAGCFGPDFAGFAAFRLERADGTRLVVESTPPAAPDAPRAFTVDDGTSKAAALPWRAGGYGSLWIRAKALAFAPPARHAELGLATPRARIELVDSTGASTTVAVGLAREGRLWLLNERTQVACALPAELEPQVLFARDDFLEARADNPWERWLSR